MPSLLQQLSLLARKTFQKYQLQRLVPACAGYCAGVYHHTNSLTTLVFTALVFKVSHTSSYADAPRVLESPYWLC